MTRILCPVCRTASHTFIDPGQATTYLACSTCAYWFKSPEHHPSLPKQKQRYDLHENDPDDPGYRAYFQRFLDWVLPQIPAGGRALDFGSGVSDLLATMLSDQGFDAVRYDPIYHPDTRYQAHRYDLIVSTEVFEHLSDPMAVFAHLAERLAPGGYLALQTQFHPNDEASFLQWYYRLDPTHIGFFTPHTFREMARRQGLEYLGDDGKNKVLFRR
jgi:SAM-dependent methyltransferase